MVTRRTRPDYPRGDADFVSMAWDEMTELPADELRRVIDVHRNETIFGGPYGRSSAGRLHHTQSQVHRFLNFLNGYTFSRLSYKLKATGRGE